MSSVSNKQNAIHLIELAHDMARQRNYIDSLKFYLRAGLQLVDHNWEFMTGLKIRGLDLADINKDHIDEILVASEDNYVYVLDQDGKEMWKYKTQSWAMSVTAIDLENDGEVKIVVGADKVYILNNKGSVVNSFSVGPHVSSLCVKKILSVGDSIKVIAGHNVDTWGSGEMKKHKGALLHPTVILVSISYVILDRLSHGGTFLTLEGRSYRSKK